jgi:hypothetical protein
VDARLDVAVGEAPAQAVVAGFACRTTGFDAARTTRQPWVEDDALSDLESTRRRTQRNHVGDDLMAHHLGKRAERRHRVVGVALAEVEHDLLGVRAADTGQSWPGDHPIIVQRLRIRHIPQAYGRAGQVAGERVGVVGHVERFGMHTEYQRPHGLAMPAAPAM